MKKHKHLKAKQLRLRKKRKIWISNLDLLVIKNKKRSKSRPLKKTGNGILHKMFTFSWSIVINIIQIQVII